MTPGNFIDVLSSYRGEGVFNPYRDRCVEWDSGESPKIRRKNLQCILDAAIAAKVDTIWVARDLGYRGGRRTGVPMTDEVHLSKAAALFHASSLVKATKGTVVSERTASIVWEALSAINEPIMLWNVFPFHPHEPHDPMTNRCHTSRERRETMHFLWDLVALLRAKRLVAIGRDAQAALSDSPISVVEVRHPSYGGQKEFLQSLYELYGVRGVRKEQMRLL